MKPERDIFCIDCGYPLRGLGRNECPECGRGFDPLDPATYSQDTGELIKLYVSADLSDVQILKDMLADEGIASTVLGETLMSARGDLPATGDTLPSLWIGTKDADRAMAITAAFDQVRKHGPDPDAQPWTCRQCGEEVEGQFTHCWNCGGERP